MTKKSPCALGLAILMSCLLAFPTASWAEPQAGGQRAGEVSRVIPQANIVRSSKTITASPKSVVDWQDLVSTQVNGRARVALDDGSVLNVGSESSIKVVKHDSGAQQTELEVTYGKLRTQAQKIAKPDGKFEVRTPAGVAGVVGTDFFVEYANGTMNVVAFEGLVKVCNLAGACVIVKAGQMTNVRNDNNSAPQPPTQATLDTLVAATKATELGTVGNGVPPPHGIGPGGVIAIGVIAALPAITLPIVMTRSNPKPPNPTCQPSPNKGCG
jgi:FecR protein